MNPADDPLSRWQDLQRALLGAAAAQSEDHLRDQAHPNLSPIGWHLEHCVFVECVWIRSALLADHAIRDRLAQRCLPELAPKSTRGGLLAPRAELLRWSSETMERNRVLLCEVRDPDAADPLRADDRILHFLVSHHAQHLETVRTAASRLRPPGQPPAGPGRPGPADAPTRALAGGVVGRRL